MTGPTRLDEDDDDLRPVRPVDEVARLTAILVETTGASRAVVQQLASAARAAGREEQQAREAAAAIGEAVAAGRVVTVHAADPESYAQAWCDGYDEAHRHGVGGIESREWVTRQLRAVLVQPRPLHEYVEDYAARLADAVLSDTDLGPRVEQ